MSTIDHVKCTIQKEHQKLTLFFVRKAYDSDRVVRSFLLSVCLSLSILCPSYAPLLNFELTSTSLLLRAIYTRLNVEILRRSKLLALQLVVHGPSSSIHTQSFMCRNW